MKTAVILLLVVNLILTVSSNPDNGTESCKSSKTS